MNGRQRKKDNASLYGFLFYSGALLIWTIYDFFRNDEVGLQVPIMFIGLAVYLWTKVLYHQKLVKASFTPDKTL